MSERYEQVERAIRDHVAAFNAQDLQCLLTGLAPDVVWQTGEDTFRGHVMSTEGILAGLPDDIWSEPGKQTLQVLSVECRDMIADGPLYLLVPLGHKVPSLPLSQSGVILLPPLAHVEMFS